MHLQKLKILHRSSKLFQPITAVQKNVQSKNQEITSKSQRLMLDVGIIKQSSPGSFHYLPLAVRSFDKLSKIVDEEMSLIDAQKIIIPTLTNAKLWKTTGRIEDVNSELFKLKDRHQIDYILSPTHEESAADLLATVAPISYKQFPIRLYQITSKYRDEMKPRFGLMRGRQFFMKDLYCFDVDLEAAKVSYENVCWAYDRIFKKIGIDFVKVLGTTGNMGGSTSHEYHFLSEIGEDKIILCNSCGYQANTELSGETCPNCNNKNDIRLTSGIEVGHTFLLGEKYSKPLKAVYLGANAKPVTLQMGSYGLGMSRILAAAIEVNSLEHEIRWPSVLAPYKTVIISPKDGSKEDLVTKGLAEEVYTLLDNLPNLNNDVLMDDRNSMTIGRRVLEAKRTGYPYIIVIGAKATENPPLFEVIDVNNNQQFFFSKEQLIQFMLSNDEGKEEKIACN